MVSSNELIVSFIYFRTDRVTPLPITYTNTPYYSKVPRVRPLERKTGPLFKQNLLYPSKNSTEIDSPFKPRFIGHWGGPISLHSPYISQVLN